MLSKLFRRNPKPEPLIPRFREEAKVIHVSSTDATSKHYRGDNALRGSLAQQLKTPALQMAFQVLEREGPIVRPASVSADGKIYELGVVHGFRLYRDLLEKLATEIQEDIPTTYGVENIEELSKQDASPEEAFAKAFPSLVKKA